MNQHRPLDTDPWRWSLATSEDIPAMWHMVQNYFNQEMTDVITIHEDLYRYNLDMTATQQRHDRSRAQLIVCKDLATGELLAYNWIKRGATTPYSRDELAEAQIAHIDLALPVRTRIRIMNQTLWYWETWARAVGVPVVVSTTIRADSEGYLRLHARAGYTIRSGIAYKRVIAL